MRKHIFATLLAATAGITSLNAQSYTINGTHSGNDTEAVLMKYARPRQKADTIAIKNGTYSFAGEAQGATFGEVHIGSMSSNPIFLEGNITIDATGKISGGQEQQCLNQWNTRVQPKLQLIQQTLNEYNELRQSGKPLADSITNHYMSIYQATMQDMVDMLIPCFEEYTDMKFPAFFLNIVQSYLPQEKILALADENPAYLEVPLMAGLKGRIEGWRKQAVGTPFTDLAMPDTTGTMRHLSEFVGKGNYVLIDFWASWCGPCRKDMPHVKALYEKYHPKGFDIVGISFDNNHKAWTAAIKKMELPWHHISDLKGWESLGSSTYGINSIPATLLIAPDGKIAAAGLRGEALDKKLAEIYGE